MDAHRYIQTVLAHDLVEEMQQHLAAVAARNERQELAEQRERAQQLMSRFAGISLTVDG